jgi:Ribbon-helix-helix protein, copG family
MVQNWFMRRFSLMIDEELYEAVGRQAAAEGVSKAELLRRFAREGYAEDSLAARRAREESEPSVPWADVRELGS